MPIELIQENIPVGCVLPAFVILEQMVSGEYGIWRHSPTRYPTLQIPSLWIPYPMDMLPPPNTLPPADTLPSWIPYPLNTLSPGRDMGPDIPLPKGHGTRDQEGTWDQ